MRLFKLAILLFVLTSQFAQGAASATAVAAVPTLTAISPESGARGSTVSVTLTGTDFESGLTITAGDNIAITGIVVTNSTTVTANFAIADTASLGQHNVAVTTSGGTSVTKVFTVVPPAPTFSGITPVGGSLGATINVTLFGTNFVSGLILNAGTDFTVRGLSVLNSSTAAATLTIASTAVLGPHDFTVTTSGGTSEVRIFDVVAPPPPTFTGISPAVGVLDSTVSVTLIGTNFISGLSVDAVDGITVSSVNVVNSTTATAIFTIAADASLGPRRVTVTTAGGTSGATEFDVVMVPPALTGISPSGGPPGATVNVVLTGSNFTTGMSVDASAGITITSIAVTNSLSATATFTIDAAADLGPRDVRVTTPGGTSGAIRFTVLPPAPTLSAIDPASGVVGTAVAVTLTGTNFYAPMTITFATDIAVSSINIVDPTSATATFTIGSGATPGLLNTTISTPGGSTSAALFSVIPLPPTLTRISPASVVQGNLDRSFLVTLTGTNLFDPTIAISGTGVKAPPNVFVTSGTTGTALFTVEANAPLGPRDVTVTTAGGTSSPIAFTVVTAAPTLTSIAPAIGVRGSSVSVTISGTNLTAGNTAVNSIAGITITNPVVVNAITLTATFAVDANATLGPRNVTVTTGLGTTNALTFTVADPFPDLSITSSHSGKFGVGFNEAYNVAVTNVGARPTSGTTTVTDVLPPGLTFVSGTGNGWSCSAAGQTVTCTNPGILAAGAPSSYTLTVAVGTTAAAVVNHTVSVATAGDVNAAHDSATDVTIVAPTPTPTFVFNPSPLVAGEQATVTITVPSTFPHDVAGTVTLTFVPSTLIAVDDPAIQFATGGRSVTFVIPANGTQARFGSATDTTPLGFQTGTVAGRLLFNGTFTAGSIQGTFSPPVGSNAPVISQQAPFIKSIETSTQGGFVASILLFSTLREVTGLDLNFNNITPQVKLSCGAAAGCSIDGTTMTFDVSAMFATWFAGNTAYGSLSLLRLPFSIAGGSVNGSVQVRLRNRLGLSNVVSFNLVTAHFGQ